MSTVLLGLGLLESAYQACLARELSLRELPFEQEKPLPVEYKGVMLDCGYRLDFIVAGKVDHRAEGSGSIPAGT